MRAALSERRGRIRRVFTRGGNLVKSATIARMLEDHQGKTVLIIDQGFLKSRHGKPVHGVELFRLHLIRQLMDRGVDVTLAAHRSWRHALRDFYGDRLPDILITPLPGVTANGVFAAFAAVLRGRRSWDAVLVGNICRGLLPAAMIVHRLRLGKRRLAMAHRPPRRDRFGRATAAVPLDILAVSEHVAGPFREAGDPKRVQTCYGIPNPERFHPPVEKRADDRTCRFALLGRLPNAFKGTEKAVESFGLLPDAVRSRCELHLVGYISEPGPQPEGVITHGWTPSEQVPDILREMDVLLTLSSNETFSQVIVQGMLTGLPVIATSLPVFVEKLDTGAGVVADSPEDVAQAMERLALDADLRCSMGEEGRRVALQRYVWSTDWFLDEQLFARRDGG